MTEDEAEHITDTLRSLLGYAPEWAVEKWGLDEDVERAEAIIRRIQSTTN